MMPVSHCVWTTYCVINFIISLFTNVALKVIRNGYLKSQKKLINMYYNTTKTFK